MTDTTGHPIRNAPLHTWARCDENEGGAQYIAMFAPYASYPMYFKAPTLESVTSAAEDFRTESIQKHEAAVLVRQENKMKAKLAAREAAAKKKEATK
jgi:hypothetical protein